MEGMRILNFVLCSDWVLLMGNCRRLEDGALFASHLP